MMRFAVAINDKDESIISTLVSLFTWSKAYHCELEFSDGRSLAVDRKGVRWIIRDYDYYEWVVIPMHNITEEIEEKIKAQAEYEIEHHNQYDYIGALLGRFSRVFDRRDKWFCSELCSFLLTPYFRLKNKWYSPGDLWKIVADAEYAYRYPISEKRI